MPFDKVDLSKAPLTAATVRDLCRKLGVSPREVLRTKDPLYEELGLAAGRHTDAELYELMARNPGLIQRPIIVKGDQAVIARPVEAVEKLLR